MCQTSLTPLFIANWTRPCNGVHMIWADTWLQALVKSLSAAKGWKVGLHTAGEVWYLRLLFSVYDSMRCRLSWSPVSFIFCSRKTFIISTAAAVAKYCNVNVCVCVCLSVFPRTYLPIFTNFVVHDAYAVARSSSGEFWRNIKVKGQFWGFYSPLTMHCTAEHLGPIQKLLIVSRCLLGWWLEWAKGTMH